MVRVDLMEENFLKRGPPKQDVSGAPGISREETTGRASAAVAGHTGARGENRAFFTCSGGRFALFGGRFLLVVRYLASRTANSGNDRIDLCAYRRARRLGGRLIIAENLLLLIIK